QTFVDNILRQRMGERVDGLRFWHAQKDELECRQVVQAPRHLAVRLEHTRDQWHGELTAHHRRRLDSLLQGIGKPIDSRGDDIVDGGGHPHIDGAQRGVAALDRIAVGFPELPQDLLHVQRVPLSPGLYQLEQFFGGGLGPEKCEHHRPTMALIEAAQRNRLPHRRKERRVCAWARREYHENPIRFDRIGEPSKELGRACIHPVQVLEYEDEWMSLALAKEKVPEQFKGLGLQLLRLEPRQKSRRDSHSDEVPEEVDRIRLVQAQDRQSIPQTPTNIL